MFSLTVFASVFDNKTETRVDLETFDQLEDMLYKLSKKPGYKPKKGEWCKNPSPLISPAIYKEGTTRANDNVIEWAGFAALDIDSHDFSGDLELELAMLYPDVTYICYSTSSSTKEHPKFRMVFPLNRPVPNKEIKHFWFALNTKFDNVGDAQTKDLSRMYYVPAIYPGAHNFIFTHKGTNESIDVDSLLQEYPWKEEKKSDSFFDRLPENLQQEVIKHREKVLKESGKSYDWTSYEDCPFVNHNLIREYKSISKIDGSGRYRLFYSIMTSTACNAVRRGYPITEYEIVNVMLSLDRATSNIYSKRPLSTEASRAISFAYKNAL